MTKDTIPEGFTVPMAIMDMIPVIFFGLSAVRVGSLLHSNMFMLGAWICLLAGGVKVLWKLIAALWKKNIWPMFVQMRIFMPLGFLLLVLALFINGGKLSLSAILAGFFSFPAFIFFCIGILGMILMIFFAFFMDSSNPKVNWLEQGVNGLAQICIFVGLLLV